MNANITVLKDESLGGIEREYREVKRKAGVGERIVFDSDRPGVTEGKPYYVRGGDHDGAEFFDDDGTRRWQRHVGANCYVIEPSDIVRINSARFRMVDRKAAVGERVIVVSMLGGNSSNGRYYKTGDIAKVVESYVEEVFADLTENADYYDDGQWSIDRIDYRVLEPVDYAQQPVDYAQQPEPLSAKPAPDQAAEIIAKLTTRVSTLESQVQSLAVQLRVVREDCVLIEEGVSDDIIDLNKRLTALEAAEVTKTSSGEVADSLSAILTNGERVIPLKSAQEIRDDIVKCAKEDVEKLLADACGDNEGAWESLPALKYLGHVTFKFAVNRQKRKVTALAFLKYSPNGLRPRFKASAKCAPGDVFNVWIGRAIALRRALGLEVPAEYFEAPNPTEVRVGDVVKATGSLSFARGSIGPVEGFADEGVLYRNNIESWRKDGCVWAFEHDLSVIDDSRMGEDESDSAEPRKEVA